MEAPLRQFLGEHFAITRRHFVKAGVLTTAALAGESSFAAQVEQ